MSSPAHAVGCVPPCFNDLCMCLACHPERLAVPSGRMSPEEWERWYMNAPSGAGSLPAYQERKRSDRDIAVAMRYPGRARRVRGWFWWPHTRDEIRAIRYFMETGDDSRLPDVYEQEERDGNDDGRPRPVPRDGSVAHGER